TSATAPQLLANYTKKRRIGSFKTDGTAHIVPFTQLGDEFLWRAAVNNASAATVGTSARTLVTVTVPTGVQVVAIITVEMGSTTTSVGAVLTSPDQTDNASQSGQQDLWANGAGQYASSRFNIRTGTGAQTAQIGIRGNAATIIYWINTLGWIDTRGRFN